MIITSSQDFLARHFITQPPVPIKALVKQHAKLNYFDATMDPDFDEEAGFTVLEGKSYFVYLNRGLIEGRDKFTLAHELGHIVLHHLKFFDPNILSPLMLRALDQDADKFAANILMPADWVTAACNFNPPVTPGNINQLRCLFGVSWNALMIRLDELGIQRYRISKNILEGAY